MPDPITIRMTLTGALKGKTKLLNQHQFVKGVALYTGTELEVEGVTKYFTRSFQVKVADAKAKAEPEDEPEIDNEAIRVDDSAVLSDDEIEEQDEQEDDPPEPNARQAEIIAAVNCIEKDKWVDLSAKTPHPKTKDIQELIGDPTIIKTEIVEVIKTWLS